MSSPIATTSQTLSSSSNQQQKQQRLTIQILKDDPNFVVINKPSNLRSVPGFATTNANNKPTNKKRKFNEEHDDEDNGDESTTTTTTTTTTTQGSTCRRTAQEAWVLAIQSFSTNNSSGGDDSIRTSMNHQDVDDGDGNGKINDDDDDSNILSSSLEYLSILASTATNIISSMPRKYKLFAKHVRRHHQRIYSSSVDNNDNTAIDIDIIIPKMYQLLQYKMKQFMNSPPVTLMQESAFGQTQLYFGDHSFGDYRVVHRLDCETSGVMVFAKNPSTASYLCKAWRNKSSSSSLSQQQHTAWNADTAPDIDDRNSSIDKQREEVVHKVYLAMVREWPPYQQHQQMVGMIDVPLRPSPTERLKWQVATDTANNTKSKPSQTEWKVLHANHPLPKWCRDVYNTNNHDEDATGIVLELRPITGRTHQLRVHCAHVGSGIIGESLYGKDCIGDKNVYDPNNSTVGVMDDNDQPRLLLHAWRLSFPYPPPNNSGGSNGSSNSNENNNDKSFCTVSSLPSWYQCYS
jgi:tRNA pseudouridine32 synthase/23S rRNA pseudouridine746 synthase